MTRTNRSSDKNAPAAAGGAPHGAHRRRRVTMRRRGGERPDLITLEAVTIEGPTMRRRPAAAAAARKAANQNAGRPDQKPQNNSMASNVVTLRPTATAPAHAHAAYGQVATPTAYRVNLVA